MTIRLDGVACMLYSFPTTIYVLPFVCNTRFNDCTATITRTEDKYCYNLTIVRTLDDEEETEDGTRRNVTFFAL